jgi:excisionase family DNA binding protein
MPSETYLRIGDAARMLSVSVDTMRRWADEGVITAYQSPGGQVKFRQRDVQDLLTRREQPTRVRRTVDRSALPNVPEDAEVPKSPPLPKWKELPPWEQRRAEVETELAIERLTAAREQERADEDRMARDDQERAVEAGRLTELKKLGRMCVTTSEATAEVIRELERYVTSEQIPSWLSKWEQNHMVQTFVLGICDRVWKEKLAAMRKP